MVELSGRHLLTLKALIAIIFCLIGLQYLSLLQVNDNHRMVRRRTLFSLDFGAPPPAESGAVEVPRLMSGLSRSVFNVESEQGPPAAAGGGSGGLPLFHNVSSDLSGAKNASGQMPSCPLIPPGLHGPIKAVTSLSDVPEMTVMESEMFPGLRIGGRYSPPHCKARHKVAIIVCFRDREEHLRILLYNLHKFLPKQQLDYGIYIVEQHGSEPFNRAMLFNVGAAEALKQHDYQCFIFHDVDLIPEDDRNIYSCPVQPRHMSVAIDTFMYKLPYEGIFGGVSAMTKNHFKQVNGFSNKFWGWGGEDDDMRNRLTAKKLYVSRYPANIARYKMLHHKKSKEVNPDRYKYLFSGAKRMDQDGYNSVKYKRIDLKLHRLYTWVLVDLPHLKR